MTVPVREANPRPEASSGPQGPELARVAGETPANGTEDLTPTLHMGRSGIQAQAPVTPWGDLK